MTVFVLRDEAIRYRAVDFLSGLALDPKHPFEIEVRPHRKKRSVEANRYYWQMLSEIAEQLWVDGKQFSKETLHHYFAGEFLGWNETALPSGEIHRTPISTSRLSVREFAEYVTQIEAWAAAHGVYFEASADYLNSIKAYLR